MSNNSIYLYTGRGADPFCARHTEKSLKEVLGPLGSRLIPINDPDYITSRSLCDVQAIVIPGGSAIEMSDAFKASGLEKIKKFVLKEGGSYLGFCAGAYLISNSTYRLSQSIEGPFCFPHPLVTNRPLKGPQFDHFNERGLQISTSEKTALFVPVKAELEFTALWYGGGAYGKASIDLDKPLATYIKPSWNQDPLWSLRPKVAALVSFTMGGTVVTSNIHPEIQMDEMELDATFPDIVGKRGNIQSRFHYKKPS